MKQFTGDLAFLSIEKLAKLECYTFPVNGTFDMVEAFYLRVDKLVNLRHLSIGDFGSLTPNKYGPFLLSTISFLSKLESLDCSNCCLKDLSPILCLTKLKYLSCNGNDLTSLPADIGLLQELEQLFCGSNYLDSLPDSIGNLSNLKAFYCEDNKISSFPFSLSNLSPNLKIWYSNNPLLSEIPRDDWKKLCSFLKEKKSKTTLSKQHVKNAK